MSTIRVAAEGPSSQWKELPLHATVGEILSDASEAFQLPGPLKLRSAQNIVITDVALIQPNDLLLLTRSGGLSPEHATPPDVVTTATATTTAATATATASSVSVMLSNQPARILGLRTEDLGVIQAVLEEARFFQVTPLIELLEEKIQDEIMRNQLTFTRREFIQKIMVSSSTTALRCQGLVLRGVDLSRLDLRNCNFSYTDFRGADLRQSNCDFCSFECCQMANVNFSGASLTCAMFSRASLEGAIMRGCNFEDGRTGQGAVFEGANLKGAQLEDSNLSRANLRVASLREANLRNCNLRLAVLAGADAEDANFENCNMDKVNLRGANLIGAKFHGATPVHSSAFMH